MVSPCPETAALTASVFSTSFPLTFCIAPGFSTTPHLARRFAKASSDSANEAADGAGVEAGVATAFFFSSPALEAFLLSGFEVDAGVALGADAAGSTKGIPNLAARALRFWSSISAGLFSAPTPSSTRVVGGAALSDVRSTSVV